MCKFENYGQLFAKLVTFPLSTSIPFCSKYDFFLALSIKRKNLLFLLLLNLNCPYTLLCPFKCTEETFPSLASRVLACFNWLLECCPAKVINLNLLSLLEDERPSGPEMSQPSFPSWSPRDMGQWQGRYLCYICFWSIFLVDFPVSEPNVPPVLEIPGVSDNEVFLGLWNNNVIASGPPLLLATVSEVSSSQIIFFLVNFYIISGLGDSDFGDCHYLSYLDINSFKTIIRLWKHGGVRDVPISLPLKLQ